MILANWKEIKQETFIWTIPKEHTKAKVTRYVPLSHTACRLLDILRKLKSSDSPRLFHLFPNPGAVSIYFAKLVKATGLEDFRFHDLRHEGISRMVLHRRHMSVYELMKIVGHSSIVMLNRYTNLRAEEMVERFRWSSSPG